MIKTTMLTFAVSIFLTGSASADTRMAAKLACEATTVNLAYDCTVHIEDSASKAALDGLSIEVKADMPSMAMAHNIPPVRAMPTNEPGIYAFPIKLDMFGNWAFSIRVSGARNDLLVEVLSFREGEMNAAPNAAGAEAGGDHSHHHSHPKN